MGETVREAEGERVVDGERVWVSESEGVCVRPCVREAEKDALWVKVEWDGEGAVAVEEGVGVRVRGAESVGEADAVQVSEEERVQDCEGLPGDAVQDALRLDESVRVRVPVPVSTGVQERLRVRLADAVGVGALGVAEKDAEGVQEREGERERDREPQLCEGEAEGVEPVTEGLRV